MNLAESYFEEISAKRYAESTPSGGIPACSTATTPCGSIGSESGESRTSYDDIDDYDGLTESPPRDALGNLRPGYDSFSVSISVRYLSSAEVSDLGADDPTDAKRISLQISSPTGGVQDFVTIYGNF